MPLVDRLKDSMNRVFPKKDEEPAVDTAHLGYGNSLRPFDDDMIISKPAIILHTLQAFFSFLAMACFASLASFQARFKVGPSGLTGFAIFITVVDLVLALFILAVPVIYDKYNKFNRLARAMNEDRVQFILLGIGAITTLLLSFIVTISAWTEPGCKNPDNDPNAKIGDDFKNGLSGWCSTKKAGAVFLWLAFAAWIASIVLAVLHWRSGKSARRRDPPFRHPTDPSGYAPSLRQAEAGEYEDEDDDEDEEPFSYPHDRRTNTRPISGAGAVAPPQIPPFRANTAGGFTMEQSPFSDDHRAGPAPGGGVGGFTSPPPPATIAPPPGQPSGPGVSRTMQYADPYAAIKANLAGGSPGAAPGYDNSYTGYR